MKLFFALTVFISGGLAYAGVGAESSDWFVCEADKDCVNISYPCAGGTVNKSFATQAKELYRNQSAMRDCALSPQPKDAPPFKVFCKNKKCESQGRNPKMGFN